MFVHHATAKRAVEANVTLTADEDRNLYVATTEGQAEPFACANAPEALNAAILDRTLRGEYPALTLSLHEGVWTVTATVNLPEDAEGEGNQSVETIYEGEALPELADLLEACEDKGIDPEQGFDDDEPKQHVVVAARYKQEYAARGNARGCGDWLHEFLDRCLDADGKLVEPTFTALLVANSVPMTGRWATIPQRPTNGWQGRYRMSGRQQLEKVVLARGYALTEDGDKVTAPIEWLEAMADKHPKVECEWAE